MSAVDHIQRAETAKVEEMREKKTKTNMREDKCQATQPNYIT